MMDKSVSKFMHMRVPRYTSYPTAPHFTPQVGEPDVRAWLNEIPPETRLSLYLHIPFCSKMCWYCGCNMRLAARYEPIAAYVDQLIEEIRLVAAALPRRHTVSHIHWGGGTPTTLRPEDFARIDDVLRKHFDIAPETEIAVEIDPRTLSEDIVGTLARIGCNRASLGVQEFNESVQQAINRVQPFEVVETVTHWLRDYGIGAVNFDLMYGLPHQTMAMLLQTVWHAIRLKPDRIALFGYAHVPWMAKNQRMIEEKALPGAAGRIQMAETAGDLIENFGYRRIGIDHFALPDDSLAVAAETGKLRRNFQGYTTDTADALIGFGASSISALPAGYAQNVTETGAYMRAVEGGYLPVAKGVRLTQDDLLRRDLIERLMCDFQVDIGQICARYGISINDLSEALDRLEPFLADGLLERSGDLFRITGHGRPVTRVIASAFDAYLAVPAEEVRHASL
ncbi:MAG TPA: oxygen-independent coproporphyrinogen III oxidase [Hyphomicrobiales bacterium]|nr:oxygen-independent coproporphyrinogen III oxidase [Hyphomicrobiales bacterium]